MADILVMGCGLMGTSLGLALGQSGWDDVLLHDSVPERVAIAAGMGAGRPWDGTETARMLLVAAPPAVTGGLLADAQRRDLAETYTHISSVQSLVQSEVESLGCDLSAIVGGHPLAGRELSGPQAAAADLFAGRPWALCPSEHSTAKALAAVRGLVEACGGLPVEVTPELHDVSVARLSHVPHVSASALAGLLVRSEEQHTGAVETPTRHDLSGPGLVDSTRLAAGDPELWTQILTANAHHVAPEVARLAAHLAGLAADLERVRSGDPVQREAAQAGIAAFLERGRSGRALVPVKRGASAAAFAAVRVDVDDRPGRLAALLVAAGAADVNVEDVHVEHVPGRPRGVIELVVRTEVAAELTAALAAQSWAVRPDPSPSVANEH